MMEMLDGKTLRERIAEKHLDMLTAISLSIQIADALEAAHSKGVSPRPSRRSSDAGKPKM